MKLVFNLYSRTLEWNVVSMLILQCLVRSSITQVLISSKVNYTKTKTNIIITTRSKILREKGILPFPK